MQPTRPSGPKLHLISHVHWDPMWYLPFEQYRMRLVRLVQRLLNILDTDPDFIFMFDGQVAAIDDYLDLHPADEARIAGHVRSGRLLIGPWYTQPEEFMPSGETHVRNLSLGLKRGAELGGIMDVSYLCDMVGHAPQMPQILRGFGLERYVGCRGISEGREITTSEFWWEGPDGSRVLFQFLPFGYWNPMPSDEAGFCRRVRELAEGLGAWSASGNLVIVQGCDHLEADPLTRANIAAYNRSVGWEQLTQTTFPRHFATIEPLSAGLPVHCGELRSTYSSFILTGILSTRMPVKLGYEAVSRSIERWAEPFSAIAALAEGVPYPLASIDRVWYKHVRNSFHDCIYGAHADTVTPDILSDYKHAHEVLSWVTGEALHALATGGANRRPHSFSAGGMEPLPPSEDGSVRVAVFNPTPRERPHAVVDATVFFEGGPERHEFLVTDVAGQSLPCQLLSARAVERRTAANGNWWGRDFGPHGHEYVLAIHVPRVPAMGFVALTVSAADVESTEGRRAFRTAGAEHLQASDLRTLPLPAAECPGAVAAAENSELKLFISADGTIDILHKPTTRWYRGLHVWEDGGDNGDQYNYSPPVADEVVTSRGARAKVSVVERGPARLSWRVEVPLTRRSEGPVNMLTSVVSLCPHSSQLAIHTSVTNAAGNHRLRLLFPTAQPCELSAAGSQFCVVERPTRTSHKEGDVEKAWGNHPHRGFVDLGGLAFLDRGIPEYEADEAGNLYITMLRSVPVLSRNELPERSYSGAGPTMATPLAQEIGVHSYDYALYFHDGDWRTANVPLVSDTFYAGLMATMVAVNGGPDSASFMSLSGEAVLLSALKPPADLGPGELVVRVYNPLDSATTCELWLWRAVREAVLVDLAERPSQPGASSLPLASAGHAVRLALGPSEIKTLRVTLEVEGATNATCPA